MSFISLIGVSKVYGKDIYALKDVNLDIGKGEWVAVMGPSGSGKTTLINILGCLDRPTSGSVVVGGRDITRLSESERIEFRRDKIGLVFQQFHLVPYLTALENVMLAQYYHSMVDEPEAREALRAVGLGDRIDHLPSELSLGEQQRVCIARAVINQPEIILADEPTGNLDEENEEIVLRIFQRLHGQGHTIVLVTHDPDVGGLADRRVELHHGRLVAGEASSQDQTGTYDETLRRLWLIFEEGKGLQVSELCALKIAPEATLQGMAAMGLIVVRDGRIAITDAGLRKAEEAIRRHRLVERLFVEIFAVRPDEVEAEARRFERTLTSESTDNICAFLKHPRTCPHGKPIPKGACCP